MEPIDYGQVVTRGWRLLIVLGVVGLVVGLLLPMGSSSRTPPTLWQTTSVVGSPPPAVGTSYVSPINSGVSTDQILYFAKNSHVAQQAATSLGINDSSTKILSKITVTGPGTLPNGLPSGPQGLVTVTVKDSTPNRSAALNNAFDNALSIGLQAQVQDQQQADLALIRKSITDVETQLAAQGLTPSPVSSGLSSQLDSLLSHEGQIAATVPDSGFQILQKAQAGHVQKVLPATPASLTRPERGLVGMGIGILIGLGIAFLIELFDTRIRKVGRAEQCFVCPVVSEIAASSPACASAYRMLRVTTLLEGLAPPPSELVSEFDGFDPVHVGGDEEAPVGAHSVGPTDGQHQHPRFGPRQVILVASASNEPSRPYVAANLATAFAEAGQQVVVVTTMDLDQVGSEQRSPQSKGEVSVADIRANLEPSKISGVSRLSLKPFVGNGGSLVTRAPAVFDALRQVADAVIVEVPPLLTVHHGKALTPVSDVVLVVSEFGYTTFADARRTGKLLRRLAAPVLGVVFTNGRPSRGASAPKRQAERVDRSSFSSPEASEPTGDAPTGSPPRIQV
jgi:Mrp family chromosome partitioning ATPase/capsular polysaccharide biosynthesis protein